MEAVPPGPPILLGAIPFDPLVNVAAVLTGIGIFVSLVKLGQEWSRERRLQRTAQANRVRAAASRMLAKLDRWQEISLSFYAEAQPVFVETTRRVLGPEGKGSGVPDAAGPIAARDHLWGRLWDLRTASLRRLLDEEIEVAYVDLCAYGPDVYRRFVEDARALRGDEERLFHDLLDRTQRDVLEVAERARATGLYATAEMGNALRTTAEDLSGRLRAACQASLDPWRRFLLETIALPDDALLRQGPGLQGPASPARAPG